MSTTIIAQDNIEVKQESRLDDMLRRYGEVCSQAEAARILSRHQNTILTMLADGRLRRACGGTQVDVRSICEYIERPEADRQARISKRRANRNVACKYYV